MQFKRCALVPDRTFVNACLGASVLFLAACGNGNEPEAGDAQPDAGTEALVLPAVWNTSDLDGVVVDVALAGGGASTLAIAYQGGGFELFSLEGDRMTEMAPIEVREIADGAITNFGDVALTLFPAVDSDGRLSAILYGDGLTLPQLTAITTDLGGPVRFLCSRAVNDGNGNTLEIAMATEADPGSVAVGMLTTGTGELVFEPTRTEQVMEDATHCSFVADDLAVGAEPKASAGLTRQASAFILRLNRDGTLDAGEALSPFEPVEIADGISVRSPDPVRALAALGTPGGGGYPNGVVVIAGRVGDADQAVFIDPTSLVESVESPEEAAE